MLKDFRKENISESTSDRKIRPVDISSFDIKNSYGKIPNRIFSNGKVSNGKILNDKFSNDKFVM